MKTIGLKQAMLIGIIFLLTACGEKSIYNISEDTVNTETQTIETNKDIIDDEIQSNENSVEMSNETEEVIVTPEENYNIAKALMKHGDLPAALKILNEISSEMDVSEELDICSEYSDYVGFWHTDEYDNGNWIETDCLWYIRIPIDIDTGEKNLDIEIVGTGYFSSKTPEHFMYGEGTYRMELDGLTASKTYEPGYKKVTTFDLSTGEYHHDYWSAGSTEKETGNGKFVKEDNTIDVSSIGVGHIGFLGDFIVPSIETVIEGVEFHGSNDSDGVEYYYFLLSDHALNDLLASQRFEDYKGYLQSYCDTEDIEISITDNEIWIASKESGNEVSMTVECNETSVPGESSYYLTVAEISEQEEEVEVKKKEPFIGMTEDEVLESTWGEPEKKNITRTANCKYEQWVYSNGRYIYLENGVVTSITWNE